MSRSILRGAGAAAVAIMAACGGPATLPALERYDPAAPARGTSAPRPPAIPADEKVSLEAILAYADAYAPAIRSANAALAQGDAARAAATPRVPSEPYVSIAVGPRRAPTGTTLYAEASIQQELEIGGQRGLRMRAAERTFAAQKHRVEQARWQAHWEVHTAFHTALVARERAVAAGRLVEFSRRIVEIARKRRDAGDISPLQVQVAEGEHSLAEQERIKAEGEYLTARLALAEVAGWQGDVPPDPQGHLDKPRRIEDVAALVERGMKHHPALAVAAADQQAAEALVRVADREAWPNPTLGVTVAREAEASGDWLHVGLVTVGIPLPLFRQNRGDRARARADLIASRVEYDVLRRAVRVRVARSAASVNAAAGRLLTLGAEIMPAFEANLAKLSRAFELGEVDVLQGLVARGRFLELQRGALDTYEDYFRSLAELEAEVGGEVWADESHEEETR